MVNKLNKQELRKYMLEKREMLSLLEVQGKSHQINQQLIFFSAYQTAKTILTYLPIKNEPDTLPLINNAWEQKKQVLIPVTQAENNSLIPSRLKNLNELTRGIYNILTPKPEYLRPVNPDNVDICILPGVAFDRQGYRLGYGGGYFDRFLPKLRTDCLKIALAYDFQILDCLPRTKFDIPVDTIITETSVHLCSHANF